MAEYYRETEIFHRNRCKCSAFEQRRAVKNEAKKNDLPTRDEVAAGTRTCNIRKVPLKKLFGTEWKRVDESTEFTILLNV